jgi:purine-binding chemotaxis protein CheW
MDRIETALGQSSLPNLNAANLMPKDANSQTILNQRAQLLAKVEIRDIAANNTRFIRFSLGTAHELYGIPYQYAMEVVTDVLLTKLPCVPAHIAGIINRRGSLIAVIDLKQLFHTQMSNYTKESSIIMVTAKNVTIGILADSVEDQDTYDTDKLDPPFSFSNIIKPEFIVGLHQGKTAIINVEALVSAAELQIKR